MELHDRDAVDCVQCKKRFPTHLALHQHKISSSDDHNYCATCCQDFRTLEACDQHKTLLHAKEQDLRCPGCKKLFNRLGGLIGHIELDQCVALSKHNMEATRKEKERASAIVKSAHEFQDYSRSGAMGPGPNPLAMQIPARLQQAQGGPVQEASVAPSAPSAPTAVFEGDDLLGVNVLDQPWGPENKIAQEVPKVVPQNVSSPGHFPPLNSRLPNIMDSQAANIPAPGAAWTVKKELFPAVALDRPAAGASMAAAGVVVTALQNQALPSKPDAKPNPYDPNSPDFNAGRYYVKALSKFKCPYLGCGKSMQNQPAFIAHLKSPAHRNEKLQCLKCLRYYATATALTQHMESQGVRCTVRNEMAYGGVVDEVTGGVAALFGRHDDKTVKYKVNEAVLSATGIAEANKAAHEADMDNKLHHWDLNMPKW